MYCHEFALIGGSKDMPRPTCQLNLTLDVPTAEYVEEIAFSVHKRPSGVGRDLLLERLELVRAGWNNDDDDMKEVLKEVAQMDAEGLDKLKRWMKKNS